MTVVKISNLGPIFRLGFNAPHIPRLIQRKPYKPRLLIFPQRDAVHYLRRNASALRELFQAHAGSDLQRTSES